MCLLSEVLQGHDRLADEVEQPPAVLARDRPRPAVGRRPSVWRASPSEQAPLQVDAAHCSSLWLWHRCGTRLAPEHPLFPSRRESAGERYAVTEQPLPQVQRWGQRLWMRDGVHVDDERPAARSSEPRSDPARPAVEHRFRVARGRRRGDVRQVRHPSLVSLVMLRRLRRRPGSPRRRRNGVPTSGQGWCPTPQFSSSMGSGRGGAAPLRCSSVRSPSISRSVRSASRCRAGAASQPRHP